MDRSNNEVAFSILIGNFQGAQIAITHGDLQQLGAPASIVSLQFRAMLDYIFNSHEFQAAVKTLASGDTGPDEEMNAGTSKCGTHAWNSRLLNLTIGYHEDRRKYSSSNNSTKHMVQN